MRKITVEFNLEEHPPKDYMMYLSSTQLHRITIATKEEMEKRYDGLDVTSIIIKNPTSTQTHKPTTQKD